MYSSIIGLDDLAKGDDITSEAGGGGTDTDFSSATTCSTGLPPSLLRRTPPHMSRLLSPIASNDSDVLQIAVSDAAGDPSSDEGGAALHMFVDAWMYRRIYYTSVPSASCSISLDFGECSIPGAALLCELST